MRTTYPTTRLLVVEPYVPCRLALAEAVRRLGEAMLIVAEGSTVSEAVGAQGSRKAADVVLLSLGHRALNGEIRSIRETMADAKIVIMSDRNDGEALCEAINAGASGFVSSTAAASEILDQIAKVAHGTATLDAGLVADGLRWAAARPAEPTEAARGYAVLSPREREILGHLSGGMRPRAVAEMLFLSRRTVECHLVNIYRKLHVHSQIEAIGEYMKRERPAKKAS